MLALLVSLLPAQSEKEAVQNRIKEIFKVCESKDYSLAAEMFVYSGDDVKRAWKSAFDAKDKNELNKVKRICRKIGGFRKISGSYSFGKFFTKNESEGKWYVQEVIFKSGSQSLTAKFAFLKINGKFLLGDID